MCPAAINRAIGFRQRDILTDRQRTDKMKGGLIFVLNLFQIYSKLSEPQTGRPRSEQTVLAQLDRQSALAFCIR